MKGATNNLPLNGILLPLKRGMSREVIKEVRGWISLQSPFLLLLSIMVELGLWLKTSTPKQAISSSMCVRDKGEWVEKERWARRGAWGGILVKIAEMVKLWFGLGNRFNSSFWVREKLYYEGGKLPTKYGQYWRLCVQAFH